jgi:hypothetical protein
MKTEMIHIGFTGTQKGMTQAQKEKLRWLLSNMHALYFHHGDCLGADAEAAAIARELNFRIVVHPPANRRHRAFLAGQEIRPTLPYLERNRQIAQECDLLIAAPSSCTEIRRSGTWATVRWARKLRKPIVFIYPDEEAK